MSNSNSSFSGRVNFTKSGFSANGGLDEDEIDALDDDGLYSKLRELGCDVGPVVESTRPLYRKMLREKMAEVAANGAVSNSPKKKKQTAIHSVVIVPLG